MPHTGSIGLGQSAPSLPSRVESPAQRSIARTAWTLRRSVFPWQSCAQEQQVLDVASRAGDRRLDVLAGFKAVPSRPLADLGDGAAPHLLVAHDAALADLFPPH